jgi:hypothetical protein
MLVFLALWLVFLALWLVVSATLQAAITRWLETELLQQRV